ncbi:MAG TPA: M48 family metallopeptidase, partial [Bacteroidota bacterium]|nr:M48 family metallopeptidase [Bacteroidota bacterium]
QCGINIFTDADDIKLGKQLDEQIRKNPKEYPILEGRPEVKQYVMEVGNKILGSPEIEKKGIYAYQYEIIHNDSVVNAFCTPGGYIYVYTGLLKFVDNEATLAGVMGHEIAHAERRHATKRITKAYGAQILLSIALGQSPSQVADISANLFTGLALLANSRGDETEADNYSMKYLANTSYYPGGITYFFEKIQGEKGKSGGGTIDRFLSTHPLPQDRIENVNNNLNLIGNPTPSEANLFRDRYQMFKKKLP